MSGFRVQLLALAAILACIGVGNRAIAADKAPSPQRISVKVGAHYKLAMPATEKLAIEDPSIADVKPEGKNTFDVSGLHHGKTQLEIYTTDGKQHSYDVEVSGEPKAISAEKILIGIKRGEHKTLDLKAFGKISKIAIEDPTIADVKLISDDGPVEVVAHKAGETRLRLWADKDWYDLTIHVQ